MFSRALGDDLNSFILLLGFISWENINNISVPWVQFSLFLHSTFIRVAAMISVPCFYLKGAVFHQMTVYIFWSNKNSNSTQNYQEMQMNFMLASESPWSFCVITTLKVEWLLWVNAWNLAALRFKKWWENLLLSKNRHSLLTGMRVGIFCHPYLWPWSFLSAQFKKHETLSANLTDWITIKWELGNFRQVSYSVSLHWGHLNLFFLRRKWWRNKDHFSLIFFPDFVK